MQQELIDRYPEDSLAVTIVWSPMMPADSEDAARKSAGMFPPRVAQFYDPKRRAGGAYRRDVFPDAYEQIRAALPDDHWFREFLSQLKSRHEKEPEWDIYMFYAPGVTWRDEPPHPTRFVRHMGRVIEHEEEHLSLMWVDGYGTLPVEGRLPDEIERLGRELLQPAPTSR